MRDELRRAALFTSGVAELSRNRAEQIVRGMVKSGDLRKDQVAAWVKNLMDMSKENRREMIAFIRAESTNQVKNLGLATKRDVERLERRVARLETTAKSAKKSTRKPTSKKSTVPRTPSKTERGGSSPS